MSPSCLIDLARIKAPRPTFASKLHARLTEWLLGTRSTCAETVVPRPYHMPREIPQRSHPFATRYFG